MDKYQKIQTIFLRDPENKYKTLLEGQFAKPEFDYLADLEWIFTEKIHGMNMRIIWDGEEVIFKGRTDNAQIPNDLLENLKAQFIDSEVFDGIDPMTLYGEGYGAGIQKGGGNYRPDKGFILFDIKALNGWLPFAEMVEQARSIQETTFLEVAPVILRGTLLEAVEKTRAGFNSLCSAEVHTAEGLVGRPPVEMRNRWGERVITKIKHADFS